ncbi:SDR family NAD(P)-dependent oxidoreductase [Sphingomonas yantingensis]|jgi:NAD(P)-dependent dehydrogenase (short-subunit alcohol dehydrogenase family)|uniref:NAD(P)-dependent dehydrogenase (Short-subunit alcohol dehydrogenase family) n=2 Tax=Sphingomonas TaxID=13687 RepID=A0A7W9ASI3_9SPHN|nr:SDR family NAD(P)-dependent oxidoreductase [Sphingomonas yantingensis]MBB5699774.1 NAD(P)-dependent dehydrogenase (short-subunit alcohol dehydrogenase family) [Sphingomonas yantingensis]HCB76325.1 short-chain dehydrogenase [Sphingomonas bacterium]
MGSAVIIGASGGIGGALADAIEEEGNHERVWRFSRKDGLDLTEEASIATAAEKVAQGPAPSLVIVATGILHDGERGPEKALKELDADWLARVYAINAIGPALVAKHFVPLFPKTGTPTFAALSARVGSIGDNALGGWHGYRASKAALNMMLRNIAIEARRKYERTIVVGLHPGTVDTGLSKPFQGNVAPGSLFAPDRAAMQLLDVLEGLKPHDSGKVFAWDGSEVPF